MIYHLVSISSANLVEIAGFVLVSFFFISFMSAIGMLSSVIARNSNISLLIALIFWLIFIVVVPNTSVFWTKNIFSIDKKETIDKKISDAKSDINRNAPKGSWNASWDNPFLPEHKLRADNQTNLMNSETNIRNAYYQDMFRQLEKTRFLTTVSPVSLYEYMNEALVGGGYLRFKKVWKDLHEFQSLFLQFFKNIDANDPDSPHWYNPYEDFSTTKKPVSFEQVPLFEEKIISFKERFSFLFNYLIIIIIYTGVIFFSSFVLFVRYDVR
jgi:ABC-type transport system involved in multi-copper enzyme maturation permease subunit